MTEVNNRAFLKFVITVMAMIAASGGMFMLNASLQPSARAKAARSSHEISNLGAGDYVFEDSTRGDPGNSKILIIRDWDESLYVYSVPIEDDKIPLPERWWGYAAFDTYCSKFGPELDSQTKIVKSGVIKCHDNASPNVQLENWKWSYDGKSKTSWITDLHRPKHEILGNYVYINEW